MGERKPSGHLTYRGVLSGDYSPRTYPYLPEEHARVIQAMLQWSDRRASLLALREGIRRVWRVRQAKKRWREWIMTILEVGPDGVAREVRPEKTDKPAGFAMAFLWGLALTLGAGLVKGMHRLATLPEEAPRKRRGRRQR